MMAINPKLQSECIWNYMFKISALTSLVPGTLSEALFPTIFCGVFLCGAHTGGKKHQWHECPHRLQTTADKATNNP